MSGVPGGGAPACITWGESKYLRKPEEGSKFKTGDKVTLVWSGGKTGGDRNTRAVWSAYLVENQRSIENTTVFDRKQFQYGNPEEWVSADECGNTQLEYTWIIPANLTSSVAVYNYEFVKLSSYLPGAESATSSTLPSTSTGALFVVMPTTTSLANATAASTAPTSPSLDPTANPTAEAEAELIPAGLSTSAKAGIGVGVSLGVISSLVAVIFLWLRRRARGREFGGSVAEESQERYDKAELDSGGQEKNNNQQQTSEADGRPLSELTARPVERMPPPQDPIELPGSGRDP